MLIQPVEGGYLHVARVVELTGTLGAVLGGEQAQLTADRQRGPHLPDLAVLLGRLTLANQSQDRADPPVVARATISMNSENASQGSVVL